VVDIHIQLKIYNDSKHDSITQNLEQRLLSHLDYTYSGVEYFNGNNAVGEIDLLGYDKTNSTLYIYEVKSNPSIQLKIKAKKQLKRGVETFSTQFFPKIFNDTITKVVPIYVWGKEYDTKDRGYKCKCLGVYDITLG